MAILEVVVRQSYYNQLVLNRYHYTSTGTPASVTLSFGLLHAMGYLASRLTAGSFASGTVAGQVQAIQVAACTTVSAYARDLYSVTDFYESPFPTPPVGSEGGEGLGPANATGFVSSRVRTDIRRGMKRYVGASETVVGPGGVLTAGGLANANNLAGELGSVITYDDEGNTITYVPCVLGLEKYTTDSGNEAYRPYATVSAQTAHLAQGMIWSVYPNVRTQTSRQYGRGA